MSDADTRDATDLANATRALAFLDTVDSGGATLGPPDRDWHDTVCGDITWPVTGGGSVVVFNDGNDWDYIDRVTLPDGVSVEPWDMEPEEWTGECDIWRLRNWEPTDESRWPSLVRE